LAGRVQNLEKCVIRALCGGVFLERPSKNKTRPRLEKKNGRVEMTFTGTLIEDLMATVERAEQNAQSNAAMMMEPLRVTSAFEASAIEPWFASVQENTDYDSKLFGVAS
jgi:hypothetical protein